MQRSGSIRRVPAVAFHFIDAIVRSKRRRPQNVIKRRMSVKLYNYSPNNYCRVTNEQKNRKNPVSTILATNVRTILFLTNPVLRRLYS